MLGYFLNIKKAFELKNLKLTDKEKYKNSQRRFLQLLRCLYNFFFKIARVGLKD